MIACLRLLPPRSKTWAGRKPWSWQRWRGLKGGQFDCATWLHMAKQTIKQVLKEAVHKYFTGEDYEPYEMVYFKHYDSQLPVLERALYVASRMVGTEKVAWVLLGIGVRGFSGGAGRGVIAGRDPDGDSPSCASAAAGVSVWRFVDSLSLAKSLS